MKVGVVGCGLLLALFVAVEAGGKGPFDGGGGRRPPPPPHAPPGDTEEDPEDMDATAWLSSSSSSHSSSSSSDFLLAHETAPSNEAEDDTLLTAADEEHDEEDASSLEALLTVPALEDKRAESDWVRRFCQTPGHEFFCAVPASFLADEFNWLGLPSDVAAIDVLLGRKGTPSRGARGRPPLPWDDAAARRMYGLVHARFIITQKGLNAMREKFERGDFGRCPRLGCEGQALLPAGMWEEEATDKEERGGSGVVKVFCPRCQELYSPADPYHQQLDGAYWGTSFPHLFLLAFPDLCPAGVLSEDVRERRQRREKQQEEEGGEAAYEPRVFGFRMATEQAKEAVVPLKEREATSIPPPPRPAAVARLVPKAIRPVLKTEMSFFAVCRRPGWLRWGRRRGKRRIASAIKQSK